MGWIDLLTQAERQYGAFARWQAREYGVTRGQIARRAERGEIECMTPVVLILRGSPHSHRRGAMAAVLDAGPGAVLSHHSAAALWDLPGFDLRCLHVSRLRSGTRRGARLAVIHQPSGLPPSHVTALDGIPVTTPARTIFDLAAAVYRYRVARTLDTAWSKRLTNGVALARVFDDLGGQGRPGTCVMRELLAERGPDYIPPDSGLEARFNDILIRDGQKPMERQVDVGGENWIGRMDFYDREARVVVQIDSDRYHSALIDKQADDRQTSALEDAGFAVLRFKEFQVWYCADEVIPPVRRARRAGVAR